MQQGQEQTRPPATHRDPRQCLLEMVQPSSAGPCPPRPRVPLLPPPGPLPCRQRLSLRRLRHPGARPLAAALGDPAYGGQLSMEQVRGSQRGGDVEANPPRRKGRDPPSAG